MARRRLRTDTGVMAMGARTATTLPPQRREDVRQRWALARHLYETNKHLFEDELDAMTALGLVAIRADFGPLAVVAAPGQGARAEAVASRRSPM